MIINYLGCNKSIALYTKKVQSSRVALTGFIQLYDGFNATGNNIIVAGPYPILPSFNNKASSYKGIGSAILCDKTFFRGKRKGIDSSGQFAENLYDWDNRASSVL